MIPETSPTAHTEQRKPKYVGTVHLVVSGEVIAVASYRYKKHMQRIKEYWDKLYRLHDRYDVEYRVVRS